MDSILTALIGLTFGFPVVLRILLIPFHGYVRRKMRSTYEYDEINLVGKTLKVPKPSSFDAPVKKEEALEMTCHMLRETIDVYLKNFFRLPSFIKHPVMLLRTQIDNFTDIFAVSYLLLKIFLSPQRQYAKMPMPPSVSSLSKKHYPF